jgi:hypothetical protein
MKRPRSIREDLFARHEQDFLDLGFQVQEDVSDLDHFGDSIIVLTSSHLRIRIVRDMGQVFADIASLLQPDVWWQLGDVLSVAIGDLVHCLPTPPELANVAKAILANHKAIEYAFSDNRYEVTRRGLETIIADRVSRYRT